MCKGKHAPAKVPRHILSQHNAYLAGAFLTYSLRRAHMKYSKYLQSEWWKQLRNALLVDVSCFGCRQQAASELQHMTYRTLGHESWRDLVPLCRSCHERLHFELRDRWPLSPLARLAERSRSLWPVMFGVSLERVQCLYQWEQWFTTVAPRGTRKNKRTRKRARKIIKTRKEAAEPTKRPRKRRRILAEMEKNRRYHARMCGK